MNDDKRQIAEDYGPHHFDIGGCPPSPETLALAGEVIQAAVGELDIPLRSDPDGERKFIMTLVIDSHHDLDDGNDIGIGMIFPFIMCEHTLAIIGALARLFIPEQVAEAETLFSEGKVEESWVKPPPPSSEVVDFDRKRQKKISGISRHPSSYNADTDTDNNTDNN